MNSDLTRNYLNGTIPSEWASLPLVNVYAIIFLSLSCTYTWQLMLFTSPNQDVDLFLFFLFLDGDEKLICYCYWKMESTSHIDDKSKCIGYFIFFSIFFFWVEMHLTYIWFLFQLPLWKQANGCNPKSCCKHFYSCRFVSLLCFQSFLALQF